MLGISVKATAQLIAFRSKKLERSFMRAEGLMSSRDH
jgi:hypothetical protein